MIAFKPTARVPKGVTPEGVLAELDDIERACGKATPEIAAREVAADPERYPMLRAFGPKDAEEAFVNAIRDGITYAVRCIVTKDDGPDSVPVRVRFLVTDAEGDQVWKNLEIIARNEPYQRQLIRELRADAGVFADKLKSVLAEIQRLM